MKAYHRIFAVILALFLVCPLLPGDLASPFEIRAAAAGETISSAEEFLQKLKANPNGEYIQTADFTIPAGDSRYSEVDCMGTYDGNGYTITVTGKRSLCGIFEELKKIGGGVFRKVTGTVKNLNVYLSNVTIAYEPPGAGVSYGGYTNIFRAGGIAGMVDGGIIENCGVSGNLTVFQDMLDHMDGNNGARARYFTGGIAGQVTNGAQILRCYSGVTLTCQTGTAIQHSGGGYTTQYYYTAFAGGIAGYLLDGGEISDCLVESAKIATGTCSTRTRFYLGGILGYEESGQGVAFTIANNIMRDSTISANPSGTSSTDSFGSAAYLVGYMDSSGFHDKPGGDEWLVWDGIKNNYAASCQLSALSQSGATAYWASGGNPQLGTAGMNYGPAGTLDKTTSNPGAEKLGVDGSGNFYWVNDIVKGNDFAQGEQVNLVWRTASSPYIKDYLNDIVLKPTDTGSTIKLTPPLTAGSAAMKSFEANQIRYEMTYEEQGRLASNAITARIETTSSTSGMLVLSGAPNGAKLQYSETENGAFQDYPAEGVSLGETSYPYSVFVKAVDDNNSNLQSSVIKIAFASAGEATSKEGDASELRQPDSHTITAQITGHSLGFSGAPAGAELMWHAGDENWEQYADAGIDLEDMIVPSGVFTTEELDAAKSDAVATPTTAIKIEKDIDVSIGVKAVDATNVESSEKKFPITVKVTASVTATEEAGSDPKTYTYDIAYACDYTLGNPTGGSPGEILRLSAEAFTASISTNAISRYELILTSSVPNSTLQWRDASGAGDFQSYVDAFLVDNLNLPMTLEAKVEDTTNTLLPSNVRTFIVAAGSPPTVTPSTGDSGAQQATRTCTKNNDTATGSNEYHSWTVDNGQLVITIPRAVAPNSTVTLRTYIGGTTRPRLTTYSFPLGSATSPPRIEPSAGGSLENGITIGAYDSNGLVGNASIWYTLDGSAPDTSSAAQSTAGTVNIPWSAVDGDWSSFTVKAVAKIEGKAQSTVSTMIYGVTNKLRADTPRIVIGGGDADESRYYIPGQTVSFANPSGVSGGTIYYTTGDTVPSSLSDTGTYTLPDDKSEVKINAVLIRDNYPDSVIANKTIKIKTKHSDPLLSIEDKAIIPIGKTLSIMIPSGDLPTEIRPAFYMKEGETAGSYTPEQMQSDPGDYYGVLNIYDNDSFDYSKYSLSRINYRINSGAALTYIPGTPEIRFYKTDPVTGGYVRDYGSGTSEADDDKTIPHQASSTPIKLTGTAGSEIKVTAWLTPNSNDSTGAFEPGDSSFTRTFYFYDSAGKPTALPTTDNDNPTTVNTGAEITLYPPSSIPDASIFYAMNKIPSIKEGTGSEGNGIYEPTNADTFLYCVGADIKKKIEAPNTPGSSFTIYAIVTHKERSQSEIYEFRYRVADLNVVATPAAWPATSSQSIAAIERGSTVTLTSATTGADIFYSTRGTPVVTANSVDGSFSPGNQYTQLYDAANSLEVTGTPGSNFMFFAAAYKDGMKSSEVAAFTYKISALPVVSSPVATPATADDNVRTLSLGDRVSLSSSTSGTTIYYSLTGLPDYNSATGSYDSKDEYNPQTGVLVEGTPGTFLTITAVAVKNDKTMTNSNPASFTYKIADLPVAAAPTASPATSDSSVTTLSPGTKISLSTVTASAQIYYSTSGGTPTQLYSDQNGITIQGDAGTFFTVTAMAKKSGMTDSPEVAFRYQLPAPVQAVYATPGEGTVVKDTEVTLATTTSGATIYYEVATRERDLDDPVANESQVYTKPIKIEEDTYISAMAVKDGVESIITEYEYKVASQVSAPEPSIPSGSIVAKGTKVTFTTTSGASIAYTKDGSDPADSENKKRMFGSEIAIDAEEGKSVSISLYATKTGMTPSEVVSVSYTVSKADEVLTANPPADSTVKPGDRITLSTSVSGAEIHYTTDGSDPTKESPKGSTVTVEGTHGETFVVRAVALTESTSTTPYTFSYKMIHRTPAPSASIPNGAVILAGASVTLTAPEGNIYYTTDSSDPTTSSQMYTEAFELTGSTVLKAIAIADGKAQSETAEYIYTMAGQVAAPTASQPSGTIDVGSKITLSTTTEGATIYYTTNGVNPTADNLRDCFTYESPITISRPVSIRMFAVRQGMNASVVNTVTYTVAEPPPEAAEEQQDLTTTRDSDRLFLFDQFVDSGEGPLYEDIVLRDALTLTVVSAQHGALPDNVQLMVERMKSPPAEDIEAVRRALDHFSLASLYDITLLVNGEAVQPVDSNLVEVGLPIPDGYEDGVALLCLINENGTVMTFPTRRSGGMLYVSAPPHFSKYGVAVPTLPGQEQSWWKPWYLWLLAAVIATAGAAALIVITKRKKEEVSK